MTTKVDMQKTYDRLERNFIKDVYQIWDFVTARLIGLCNVL